MHASQSSMVRIFPDNLVSNSFICVYIMTSLYVVFVFPRLAAIGGVKFVPSLRWQTWAHTHIVLGRYLWFDPVNPAFMCSSAGTVYISVRNFHASDTRNVERIGICIGRVDMNASAAPWRWAWCTLQKVIFIRRMSHSYPVQSFNLPSPRSSYRFHLFGTVKLTNVHIDENSCLSVENQSQLKAGYQSKHSMCVKYEQQ